MPLRGDLSAVGLADVFQMLAMSQRRGTLIVQDSQSRKCIYVAGNTVRLLSAGVRKGLRLGEILVRDGRITAAQLEEVLAAQKETPRQLGELVVGRGWVSEEEIHRLVRRQIEEEIYDLFLWSGATFEFIEGDPPPELTADDPAITQLVFDVNGLLMEACRRIDEWGRIHQVIPSIDAVFRWSQEEARGRAMRSEDEMVRWLARALDGQTSVRGLSEATAAGKFAVCRALLDLIQAGEVVEVAAKEVAAAARAAQDVGETDKALRLWRSAVGRAGDEAPTEWMAALAELMARTDRYGGGTIFMQLAERHRQAGREGELVTTLERALKANPRNRAARAELFDLLHRLGRQENALEHGEVLVTQALHAGEVDEALAVANKMRVVSPKSLLPRVVLLRVLHARGAAREAAEELRLLVRNLKPWEEQHQRIEREMRERFPEFSRAMTEGTLPLERPRRKAALIAGSIAVLALLVAGVVAYKMLEIGGDDGRGGGQGQRPGPNPNGGGEPPGPETIDQIAARFWAALEQGNCEDAGQKVAALAARGHQGDSRAAAEARRLGQRLEEERTAGRLRQQVDAAVQQDDIVVAARLVERLVTEYGHTRAVAQLQVPLKIVTAPPGARVQVEEEAHGGKTPTLLWFPVELPAFRITLSRRGFRDKTVTLTGQDRFRGEISFEFDQRLDAPGWPVLLDAPAISRAWAAGDRLAVVAVAGWLVFVECGPDGGRTLGRAPVRLGTSGGAIVAGDLVVVVDDSGTVSALRHDLPGEVRWRGQVGSVSGPPVVAPGGDLVVCGQGNRLLALRLDSGDPVGEVTLPAAMAAGPFVAGGRVLAVGADHRMYAWRSLEGPAEWVAELRGPVSARASPGDGGDWIAVGLQGGEVVALEATGGRELWRTAALGGSIHHGPLVVDGLVYVVATDRRIYVVADGAVAVREDLGGGAVGSPVVVGQEILVSVANPSGGGVVRAFRHREMKPTWRYEMTERPAGPPTVAGRFVVVPGGRRLGAMMMD